MKAAVIAVALLASAATAAPVDDVIADMEKRVAAEPGQDERALHLLSREFSEHLEMLTSPKWRSRRKILAVVSDKTRDWRLRVLLSAVLQYDDSMSVAEPLLGILKDDKERPEVRGGAARGLAAVSVKSQSVCEELNGLAASSQLPREALSGVMFSIQECGCDDPDAMFSIMRSTPTNLNGLSVNFGAIRCLAASSHPRALEYLANIIISEPDASLLRGVAIDVMLRIANNEPSRFAEVAPRLTEPLIAMTYSEKLGNGNLNVALQLIGKTRDPRAVDRLIELLDHPEALICSRSVEALGEIGDPKALPGLLKVWKNIPTDSRSNYRWRHWYRRWRRNPQDPAVAALVRAIERLGGKLDPPEHPL